MRTLHGWTCGLALGAGLAAVAATAPVDAAVSGHLYIAYLGHPAAIERFPLVNGMPASTPDFRYPGFFDAVAVGLDGSVYGYHGAPGNRNGRIEVFPNSSAQPARTIAVPGYLPQCAGTSGGPVLAGALAVDRKGNVFLGYTTYVSGARRRSSGVASVWQSDFPCLGVVGFGPTAHGQAPPESTIALRGQYILGVTVDADERLFVANEYFDEAEQFRRPAHHPVFAGIVATGMMYPLSLTTDDAENLYELDGEFLPKNGVNVYPAGATSTTPPSNTITFVSPYQWVNDIAVRGPYLYASDNGDSTSIDVYPSNANGPTSPLMSVQAKDLGRMAAGP